MKRIELVQCTCYLHQSIPHTLLSTGFKCGEFRGQSWGG